MPKRDYIKDRILEDMGRVPTYTYRQVETKLRRRKFSSGRAHKLIEQELEPIALVNRQSDAQYERGPVDQLLDRLHEYKKVYRTVSQLADKSGYSKRWVRELIHRDQSSIAPQIRFLKSPYVEFAAYNWNDFNKLLKKEGLLSYKRQRNSKQTEDFFDLLQRVTLSSDQVELSMVEKQRLTKASKVRINRISGRILLDNQNRLVVVLRNGEILTTAQALKRDMVPELYKKTVVYNYGSWVGLDETVKIGESRLFRDKKLMAFIDFLYERFAPSAYSAMRDGQYLYLTIKEGNSILNIEGMAFQSVKQMGDYLMQLCPTLAVEVEKRPEKNRANFIVHSTKEHVTIGINPKQYPKLKQYAQLQGKSVNALASDIVNAWIKQNFDKRVAKQVQAIDALIGPSSDDSDVSDKSDADLEDDEWEEFLNVY